MERQEKTKGGGTADLWKRSVAETLLALRFIPDRFTGKVVITFKDGGVSYLEKTETFK